MLIDQVDEVTDELLAAFEHLIPQLGFSKTIPSRADLTLLLRSNASSLLIARYPDRNGEIVGSLTIAIYRVPTGIRSIVEDVIVDERYRRKGIARALIERAIEIARQAGADGVALTSNPKRAEANLLYQKIGFQKRETNSYYLGLK